MSPVLENRGAILAVCHIFLGGICVNKNFRLAVGLLGLALSATIVGCGDTDTGIPEVPFANNPSPAYKQTEIVDWNKELLAAFTATSARPTVNCRNLFIVHASIYDAWAAYTDVSLDSSGGSSLRRPSAERTVSNQRAAALYAAYHACTALFPAYETANGRFRALLVAEGLDASAATLASVDPATAAGTGHQAFLNVQAVRASDGSNAANNFVDITSANYPTLYAPVNSADPTALNSVGRVCNPGDVPGITCFDFSKWAPLRVPTGTVVDGNNFPAVDNANPASFRDQTFLTPHWGAVRPFALSAFGQLRPAAPPTPGSAATYTDGLGRVRTEDQAYNEQVDEVLSITAGLTERQKAIAEYWADGPASVTPPGHWNDFAQDVSFRDRNDFGSDVKMFFALNAGLLDSSICCWEAKRFYDFIRPVSAIQHKYFNSNIQSYAGPGLGTQTIPGRSFRPFQSLTFVTPAFAEYTSGHSTFSACGAQILSSFSGRSDLNSLPLELPVDRNNDGVNDKLGEYTLKVGSLGIEPGLPTQDVTLSWSTLQEAADEAGISRLYGGIHFQDGDRRGRIAGRQVGAQALAKAQRLFAGQP